MTIPGALTDPLRLGELRALAILDTPPERDFDALAARAAAATHSRVAAVNFVDAGRHYTKAIVGSPESQSTSLDNEVSLCAVTVNEPDGVLIVPDLRADERWDDHPLVHGDPGIGFYMGVSIVSGDQRVGVVCAFGPEPREITGEERRELELLAEQAAAQLRLRRRSGTPG